MTQHVLFLHSSCDKKQLQDLERQAVPDVRDSDWRIWIDKSAYASETLSAAAPLEEQIRAAIEHAFAIVYVVGRTGPGAFQAGKEAPWIHAAIQARHATGRPLRFVPVLLPDGREADLHPWMLQYPVVNSARSLSYVSIWREVFGRLNAVAPLFDPQFVPVQVAPVETVSVDAVVAALGNPENLSLLIGPYGDQQGRDFGPASLTERLLKKIDLSAKAFQPWLPWPSESAEWVRLGMGPRAVDGLFTGREFTLVSQSPPLLLARIANLAMRWQERHRHKERRKGEGWSGLILLNTRVDLALEYALLNERVSFTRLTPSARNSDRSVRQMFQNWSPGTPWEPESGISPPTTSLKVRLEGGSKGLAKLSLDEAGRIMVVKLFGSIEIDGSLITTAAGLFKEATALPNLPKELVEAIEASPQVLVGNGLASPSAQLARQFVLGERNERKPRVLVVPQTAAVAGDSLIDLELQLLDRYAERVRDAMDLEFICRVDAAAFISRLAGQL